MKNQIISAWKQLAKNKQITARNTLTYILLRADGPTEALIHIRRAFSPIKSPNKLANGRRSYDCLWTRDNYDMFACKVQGSLTPWLRESIRKRFAEFGIEATDSQIEAFHALASDTMRNLK